MDRSQSSDVAVPTGERTPHAAARISEDEARALATRLLEAAGAQPGDADAMARSLVAAERAGQSGHGLSRLPGYVGRLRAGGTVSGPWRPMRRTGPVESYDGHAGLGHVHLEQAVERAAALAAEHGVGVVGVAGSNHAGALGTRARALAERGLVALIFTNAPAVLAPPGGSRAVLGTNPIALAAPMPDGPPLVCDLATAQVSRGQVMRAAQEGLPIPRGWALDGAGTPTEDAAAALAGTLMPLGGAKGFALALLVEVLTGALLGPAVGPEIGDFFGDGLDRPQDVSHLVIALDPAALGEPAAFLERMGRLRDAVHEAGAPGATRLPGSRAPSREAAAGGGAIEIGEGLTATLTRLSGELGVAMPSLSGS
jgi:(2R)-3-sulfolactate dehydrogenase (NADP+)